MKNYKLLLNTKSKKYPIIIGNNIAKNTKKIIENHSIAFNNCLFLIDKNLNKKEIHQITSPFKKQGIKIYFNSNEKNKNLKTIIRILEI